MKKALFLLALAGSLSAYASGIDDPKNLSATTLQEIKNLVNSEVEILHPAEALVIFTVNSDNEIAVLDVETAHPEIKQLVKDRMNGRRISSEKMTIGNTYKFRLKIQK